jgi:hypothetical protein
LRYQEQPRLDCPEVSRVQLNLKCRDEIIPILQALQHVYEDAPLRRQLLDSVGKDVCGGCSRKLGRKGLDYWSITVLAAVRLGCNLDYDKLQNLAEEHRTLRMMMGIGDWEEKVDFDWRRIRDNVCLLRPETVVKINQLIVAAGHKLVRTTADPRCFARQRFQLIQAAHSLNTRGAGRAARQENAAADSVDFCAHVCAVRNEFYQAGGLPQSGGERAIGIQKRGSHRRNRKTLDREGREPVLHIASSEPESALLRQTHEPVGLTRFPGRRVFAIIRFLPQRPESGNGGIQTIIPDRILSHERENRRNATRRVKSLVLFGFKSLCQRIGVTFPEEGRKDSLPHLRDTQPHRFRVPGQIRQDHGVSTHGFEVVFLDDRKNAGELFRAHQSLRCRPICAADRTTRIRDWSRRTRVCRNASATPGALRHFLPS